MGDILERLIEVARTEGRARSAYDCYTRIRMMGPKQARVTYNENTWYTHLSLLKKAGLSKADLQPVNIIPLKKRQIVLSEAIGSWGDIQLAS